MRVISKRTLRLFWEKHTDSEQSLKSWYREAEKNNWNNFNELIASYPSASILLDNRVVFRINGNKYRLIAKYNLSFNLCWIRFVGTHAEYDKINANTI
jgi:mRNA interferase HigB